MTRLEWLERYAKTPEELSELYRLKQDKIALRKKAYEKANKRGTGRKK